MRKIFDDFSQLSTAKPTEMLNILQQLKQSPTAEWVFKILKVDLCYEVYDKNDVSNELRISTSMRKRPAIGQ